MQAAVITRFIPKVKFIIFRFYILHKVPPASTGYAR